MALAKRVAGFLRRSPHIPVGIANERNDALRVIGRAERTQGPHRRGPHPRAGIGGELDEGFCDVQSTFERDPHTHLTHSPRLIRQTGDDRGNGLLAPHVQQRSCAPQLGPVQRRCAV